MTETITNNEGLINQEIQKTEQRNRIETSAALIENPIRDGEIGADKVFIQADSISHNDNSRKWIINISSQDSSVVLDDKWKEKLSLENSPIVMDLRKGGGEKKLISGGTWVWVEDSKGNKNLALMRRDKGAPFDAFCLTGPAGRCGEKLSKTSIDETNQEFIFLKSNNSSENRLLTFYRNEEDKEEAVRQKLRQVGEVFKALMDNYEKTGNQQSKDDSEYLVTSINGEENLELIKLNEVKDEEQELDEIIMTIDGKEVDKVKGIAFMDEGNNTLEVREVVNIKLPEGSTLSKVMDGEVFLRKTSLIPEKELKSLKDDKLVPALRNYIERIANK